MGKSPEHLSEQQKIHYHKLSEIIERRRNFAESDRGISVISAGGSALAAAEVIAAIVDRGEFKASEAVLTVLSVILGRYSVLTGYESRAHTEGALRAEELQAAMLGGLAVAEHTEQALVQNPENL